jgi:hypothetical protein
MLLSVEWNEKMLIGCNTAGSGREKGWNGLKLPFRSCQELGMCLFGPCGVPTTIDLPLKRALQQQTWQLVKLRDQTCLVILT